MSQLKLFQETRSRMTLKERECFHEQIAKTSFPGLVSCKGCGYVAPKRTFRLIRKLMRWQRVVPSAPPTARQIACAAAGHGRLEFKGVGEVDGIVHRLFECGGCRLVRPKGEFKKAAKKARNEPFAKDRQEGRGTAQFSSVEPLWGSD